MTMTMTTKIWISALIPSIGADTYDGVRLQASLTERDCYEDLAEWLEIEYESIQQVTAALEKAAGARPRKGFALSLWKVEEQAIFEDFTQTDLTKN